jgi:hypothetical protein
MGVVYLMVRYLSPEERPSGPETLTPLRWRA